MKLEVNTPNARRLLDISPLPRKVPEFLYHITKCYSIKSIMENGIRPHPLYGEMYFTETFDDALMFAKTDRSYVIKVETRKLDRTLIRVSEDHERKIFDCNCYRYFKTVPLEAIIEHVEVQRKPYLTTLGKLIHVNGETFIEMTK